MREWAFVLYPDRRPTEADSDRFDHADALAGGEIGWEEDPSGVRFPCTVKAGSAGEAVAWAVAQLAGVGLTVAEVRLALADFRAAT